MIRSGEGRGGGRPGEGGKGRGREGGRGGGSACARAPAASRPRPAPRPPRPRRLRPGERARPPRRRPRSPALPRRAPAAPPAPGGGAGSAAARAPRSPPRAPGPGALTFLPGGARRGQAAWARTVARWSCSSEGSRAPLAGKCPRRPRLGAGRRPPPRVRHLRNSGRFARIRDAPAADTLAKSCRSVFAATDADVPKSGTEPS